MENKNPESREELALDALLAAALRQPEEATVTDEDIEEFLKTRPPLSAEAKAALKKLGADVVSRLTALPAEDEPAAIENASMAPLYAAMNRNNAAGQHDPKTEEELERKRKDILARLKKKQQGTDQA